MLSLRLDTYRNSINLIVHYENIINIMKKKMFFFKYGCFVIAMIAFNKGLIGV